MTAFRKPSIALPQKPGDPRIGHLLGTGLAAGEAPDLVLIGFPEDRGVARNGGRAGAAEAPERIREALYRMTPDPTNAEAFVRLVSHTVDLGNLDVGEDVETGQRRLGDALAPHLARGASAVVLGGGHETTFSHFLGYATVGRDVEIVNWDAHPDVRELVDGKGHSGSPFRQAIEHRSGRCKAYTVAGLQRHSTASAHLAFLREKNTRFFWIDETTRKLADGIFAGLSRETLVSFDMDVVDQAFAPGVSAPTAGGLSAEVLIHAARLAGKCELVRSIDFVETNPRFDPDGRTSRLAALLVWSFLRGMAERST